MSHATERSNRRRILAACCGAHVIQDGLVALQFVLLPILATQFGLNYSQVGLLRAISNSAMSALEIPAGLLAERFGERRLLVFGLITAGAGYLGVAVAPGFTAIALFFLLAGMGAGFQHSLASATIVNTFSGGERRRSLGTYNASGDAGKLAYTGLFSLGLGMGLGWNVVVTALAGLAVVFACVLWLWLASYRGVDATVPSRDRAGGAGRWGVIDRTGFSILGTIVFLDSGVQIIFLTFLAFMVIEKGGGGGLASLAVVLALSGGMVGKYLGGYLASRLGDRNAFVLIQLLSIVGLGLLVVLPAMPLLVLLPFIGMVIQGSSTVTYGCIAGFVDADRQARGFALIYSLASVSAVAGPVAFGFIADQTSLGMAIVMLVVLTAMTLPLSFVLTPGSPEKATP